MKIVMCFVVDFVEKNWSPNSEQLPKKKGVCVGRLKSWRRNLKREQDVECSARTAGLKSL